jgi:hypothetical protein
MVKRRELRQGINYGDKKVLIGVRQGASFRARRIGIILRTARTE